MKATPSPPGDAAGWHPLLARLRALRRRSAVGRFMGALVLPWRAARFLAGQRRLWLFIALPALINAVLFVAAVVLLVGRADDWLGAWWAKPGGEAGLGWLLLAGWYVAWLAAVALGLALAYVLVLLVGGIIASPFNDVLSERTEQCLTGRADVPQPGDSFLGGILSSIGSTATITGLYVVLMIPVLLLSLAPGLGSLAAAVLGGFVSAFFLALEYTDTLLERYGFRLREKVRLLRGNLALAVGFGLGASLLLWIPLLNFLCIPIAVVGGTALALGLVEDR